MLIQGTMEGKYTGTRLVHSLGEVKAIVEYTKNEKIYLKEEQKVKTGKKEQKYGIKFNNFQINFYKTLSKFEIYDTIEEEKKLRIFSNLYLPISVKKIMKKRKKYQKNTQLKKLLKREQNNLNSKSNQKLKKKIT